MVDFARTCTCSRPFKILELWAFRRPRKCYHLGYGFVTLPEGAMSRRAAGGWCRFKDVADEAVSRVLAEIEQKNPDLPFSNARKWPKGGIRALAYGMLSVDNNKDIVFDMKCALNFDGHTGSYIQNAHVRASSILNKAGVQRPTARFDYSLTTP